MSRNVAWKYFTSYLYIVFPNPVYDWKNFNQSSFGKKKKNEFIDTLILIKIHTYTYHSIQSTRTRFVYSISLDFIKLIRWLDYVCIVGAPRWRCYYRWVTLYSIQAAIYLLFFLSLSQETIMYMYIYKTCAVTPSESRTPEGYAYSSLIHFRDTGAPIVHANTYKAALFVKIQEAFEWFGRFFFVFGRGVVLCCFYCCKLYTRVDGTVSYA